MDGSGSKAFYPSQTGQGGGPAPIGPGVFTTLHVTGTSALDGNVTMGADLDVTGDITANGALDITGNVTMGGTVDVTGTSMFHDDVTIISLKRLYTQHITNTSVLSGILIEGNNAGAGSYAVSIDVSGSTAINRQILMEVGAGGAFDVANTHGGSRGRMRLSTVDIDGAWNGLTASTGSSISAGNYLANTMQGESPGTLPSTGAVRLTKLSSQVGIVGRTNADIQNMTWIIADTSDNITVGDVSRTARLKLTASNAVQIAMATPVLEMGTGTVSGIGSIRNSNNTTIIGALTAGGLDIYVAGTNASNDVLLGGTVNTSRTVIRGSVATQLTTGVLEMTGATVAAAGEIRSPAATARTLWGCLKNGGGGDLTIVAVDASNNITYGDVTNTVRHKLAAATAVQIAMATPNLEIGTTNLSTTGLVNFGAVNGTSLRIAIRNAGNTATMTAIETNSSDNIAFGDTTNTTRNLHRASTAVQIAMSTPVLELGTASVAASGTLRSVAATARTMWATLNNAGGADLAVLALDASDNLYVGGTSAAANQFTRTKLMAATAVQIGMATPNLEIGTTNLSTTGLVNFGAVNGNSLRIAIQNAGNTAAITAIATDSSNNLIHGDVTNTVRNLLRASTAVQVAMATPVLEIGTGTLAGTGQIRLASGTTPALVYRNNGNTADVTVFAKNATEVLFIGQDTSNGTVCAGIQINSTGTISIQQSGTSRFATNATGISFFNVTQVARQTSGENLTNNVTVGGTDGTIANYTDLVVYANDAAAIRNDIYQLARKLKQVNDGLRSYGLLT